MVIIGTFGAQYTLFIQMNEQNGQFKIFLSEYLSAAILATK